MTGGDIPIFYPKKMVDWFELYCWNRFDKSGHDALIGLADQGLRELIAILASIYQAERTDMAKSPVDAALRAGSTTGHMWRTLCTCMKHVDIIEPSSLDGSLVAC